jgi:Flp pilus assembly protein TadD
MSGAPNDADKLRRLAENALAKGADAPDVTVLLTQLLHVVGDQGEHALFAHRHLAELRIESDPWQAALHLRRVAAHNQDDDVVHALMGLCQALLGNFRAAVAAYRRALQLSPQNPWYHHNLGHLLDVALERAADAEHHLRNAHRMEPLEHEITASLAHCLARLARLDEARELADEAVTAAPRNASHRDLLEWIEGGARDRPSPRLDNPAGIHRLDGKELAVERALERGMQKAGFSKAAVARARALWADFHDGRSLRVIKPETYAAAVEYAITFVMGVRGVTKASIARRYGIAPATLTTRYGEIRDALDLEPGDPRYA